jgi:hypothetical protein
MTTSGFLSNSKDAIAGPSIMLATAAGMRAPFPVSTEHPTAARSVPAPPLCQRRVAVGVSRVGFAIFAAAQRNWPPGVTSRGGSGGRAALAALGDTADPLADDALDRRSRYGSRSRG